MGADIFWDQPAGGDFGNEANWDPESVPGASDTAIFDLNAAGAYSVTFGPLITDDVTNQTLIVGRDTFGLDLDGRTYTLTGDPSDQDIISFVAGSDSDTSGQLTLTNGTVVSDTVRVALATGTEHTVILNGSSTSWQNSGTGALDGFMIGDLGRGTVEVQNGASLNAVDLSIGQRSGGEDGSRLTVTGPGSTVTVQDTLSMGWRNATEMEILNGATVNVEERFNLGGRETSTLDVVGENSVLNISGDFFRVGIQQSDDVVTVEDGGTINLDGTALRVGDDGTAEATLILRDGGNLQKTGGGVNRVGAGNGNGTIRVEAGGQMVLSTQLRVGDTSGATGTLLVTGENAMADINQVIRPGFNGGTGFVTVEEGGFVTTSNVRAAEGSGGTGTIVVTGQDSLLESTGHFVLGGEVAEIGGTASLLVSDSGLVTAEDEFVVWDGSRVDVDNGRIETFELQMRSGSELGLTLHTGLFDSPIFVGDEFIGDGNTSLDGVTFDLDLAGGFDADLEEVFGVLRYYGELSGQFVGLDQGDVITVNGFEFQIDYGSGLDDFISLTVIPEPTSAGLACLALLAWCFRRRRMPG